ncbi:hypothetical protein DOC35_19560 [Salmonella enterica subsp. enterica]|nr:hypothetical protein [Salmonella enterica subsp. enterica]
MSKAPVDIFTAAQGVGDGAPLKTAERSGAVKSKLLRNLPIEFFERYEAARKAGATTLGFSAFIVEAMREKLEAIEKK